MAYKRTSVNMLNPDHPPNSVEQLVDKKNLSHRIWVLKMESHNHGKAPQTALKNAAWI